MKKPFMVLLTAAVAAFMAGGAWGYDFNNHTLVEAYYKGSPYPNSLGSHGTGEIKDGSDYWYDRIGDAVYETYGVNVSGTTMSIFTNMPSGGTSLAKAADLFFDTDFNGTWDVAIDMQTGNIYTSPTYLTSDDIYKGTNLIYGGRWDSDQVKGAPFSPAPVPTRVTGGTHGVGDQTTVQWVDIAGTAPNYRIDITLNEVLKGYLTADYAFIWGSGECANDTAEGKVPLPGALVLLGAGLIRLVAYGRKRRNRV